MECSAYSSCPLRSLLTELSFTSLTAASFLPVIRWGFIPSICIPFQLNSWNWIMVPDESLLRYDLYLHKFFSCCLFVHCRAGRTMPCWWPAWYLHSYPPFGWLIDWWSATLTFTVHFNHLQYVLHCSFAVLLLKLNYVFVVGWIDQWIIQHIDFNTI